MLTTDFNLFKKILARRSAYLYIIYMRKNTEEIIGGYFGRKNGGKLENKEKIEGPSDN